MLIKGGQRVTVRGITVQLGIGHHAIQMIAICNIVKYVPISFPACLHTMHRLFWWFCRKVMGYVQLLLRVSVYVHLFYCTRIVNALQLVYDLIPQGPK
jgi:hypothetical protein